MPGRIDASNLGSRIEETGPFDLTVKDAVDKWDDDGRHFVLVTWEDAGRRTWLDRVGVEGRFAWQLGRVLAGLGLPHKADDPWDETAWVGRRSRVTLLKNAKGFLYGKSYEPIGEPVEATAPQEPAETRDEDDDIPF